VVPLSERGKLPDQIPLFKGHSGPVLDTDFNPFNDSVIASGSDDGKVALFSRFSLITDLSLVNSFRIYNTGKKLTRYLTGFQVVWTFTVITCILLGLIDRKVGNVTFHPIAENVLASASGDYTLKLWDIISSSNNLTLTHPDIIQSLAFNREGSTVVTTCRDKKLRIWDPRTCKVAQEAAGHVGAKNSRAVWIYEGRIASAGFGKMSDRQLALWDIKNLSKPIGGFTMLDQSAGVVMVCLLKSFLMIAILRL
jgi:coronin-1B/1C/6